LEGEILEPEQEQPTVRIDVHHHRSGIRPQHLVIGAALVILALILFRSPGALILLVVLVPRVMWLTIAVMVVIVAIVAWRAHRAGLPF
jgi:hypothetical protein